MTDAAPVQPIVTMPVSVLQTITQDQRLLNSEELFSGQREVLIAHGQEIYRLRLTRSNKLILHK
jgi:hemin uptake protein HemP